MPDTSSAAISLPASEPPAAQKQRVLGVACSAHALHDGFTDLLYVLLPVWQAQFGLGYAEVGTVQWAGKTYRSVLMKKTLATSPQT